MRGIILWVVCFILGSGVTMADDKKLETATFAGGCFWCMQPPFDNTEGVISTKSGYIGGDVENPTYEQISTGRTGHAESVEVKYDPEIVTYEQLLEVFWKNIDPTVENRQFCDVGSQYRTAIFYHNDEQKLLAEESKAKIAKERGIKVMTEVSAASSFYDAEDYHQDYYLNNPLRYKAYKTGCGRDDRLKEIWD